MQRRTRIIRRGRRKIRGRGDGGRGEEGIRGEEGGIICEEGKVRREKKRGRVKMFAGGRDWERGREEELVRRRGGGEKGREGDCMGKWRGREKRR
jgi:hypothetical protein